MKNLLKDRKIWIVPSVVTILIGLLLVYLFIATLMGIQDLNYPLTGVTALVMLLFGIIGIILLNIGFYKKYKDKSVKRIFIIAIILIVLGFISYMVIPSINRYIQNNNIGYKDQGNEEYSIKGISYEIPKSWRTEEFEDGYYHYPSTDNSDGLLYVISEYDSGYGDLQDDDYDVIFDNLVSGMKESSENEYMKVTSTERIKILDYEAIKITYDCTIDNTFYENEIYAFIDSDASTIYSFAFAMKDEIDSEYSEEFSEIINSISERWK